MASLGCNELKFSYSPSCWCSVPSSHTWERTSSWRAWPRLHMTCHLGRCLTAGLISIWNRAWQSKWRFVVFIFCLFFFLNILPIWCWNPNIPGSFFLSLNQQQPGIEYAVWMGSCLRSWKDYNYLYYLTVKKMIKIANMFLSFSQLCNQFYFNFLK